MFGNITQILEMKKKAEELKGKLEAITITETSWVIKENRAKLIQRFLS